MGTFNEFLRKKIKKVTDPTVEDVVKVAKEEIKKHFDADILPIIVTAVTIAITYHSLLKPPKSAQDVAKVINNYYYNYYIIKK